MDVADRMQSGQAAVKDVLGERAQKIFLRSESTANEHVTSWIRIAALVYQSFEL